MSAPRAKARLIKIALDDLRKAWMALVALHESAGSARGSWSLRSELVGFALGGEVIDCDDKERKRVEVGYAERITRAEREVAEAEAALRLSIEVDEQ